MLCLFEGQSVEFFGREYQIHSCDDFTRSWLQSEGIQLGADEQPPSTTPEPDDAPTKTSAQVAFEKRQRSRARARPKSAAPRLSSQSQGNEEDAAAAAAAEEWRPGQKLKQYLENDGKVLR